MDWFLYDNGVHHERVNSVSWRVRLFSHAHWITSFACKYSKIAKLSFFNTRISDLETLTDNQNGRPYQTENTEILPNFLVWKFVEKHNLCIVSGDSPETLRKLCVSEMISHQEIKWNFGILRSYIRQNLDTWNISSKYWKC